MALLAIVTCTFGNLAAYGQTNIKRLLAYSTIAHAGYMMMAMPPMLALLGSDVHGAQGAVAALVIYIAVYLFMNLGAFAVVAFLRDAMHSEEIADYAGLLRRCPGVAICFSIILLSLIGLPPLSGFLGKFAVFAALTDAFRATGRAYLDGAAVCRRFEHGGQPVLLPPYRPADDDDARAGVAHAIRAFHGVPTRFVSVAGDPAHGAVHSGLGAPECSGIGRGPFAVCLTEAIDRSQTAWCVMADHCGKEIA